MQGEEDAYKGYTKLPQEDTVNCGWDGPHFRRILERGDPKRWETEAPPEGVVKPMNGRRVKIVECKGGVIVELHTPATGNTEYAITKDAVEAVALVKEFLT